jgi:hypothetical protein
LFDKQDGGGKTASGRIMGRVDGRGGKIIGGKRDIIIFFLQ